MTEARPAKFWVDMFVATSSGLSVLVVVSSVIWYFATQDTKSKNSSESSDAFKASISKQIETLGADLQKKIQDIQVSVSPINELGWRVNQLQNDRDRQQRDIEQIKGRETDTQVFEQGLKTELDGIKQASGIPLPDGRRR